MILEDYSTYADRQLVRRWSDRNVYLMNEAGVMYGEAVDPVSIPRAYIETDVPIETDGEGLIARMPGYRLVTGYDPQTSAEAPSAAPEPEPVPAPEDAEIAALEARLAQLKANR